MLLKGGLRDDILIENKGGGLVVCTLREKIISCACLVGSGLKFIFH